MIPYANTLVAAIGLGLVISLFFSEKLGLTASGLVVPGYIAVYLNQPLMVVLTLLVGIVTMLILRVIGRFVLLYGRRTLVLCVIIGFLLAQASELLRGAIMEMSPGAALPASPVIGYIIGGLIGYWMVRQGIVETAGTVVASSFLVRLLLVLANGVGLMHSPML